MDEKNNVYRVIEKISGSNEIISGKDEKINVPEIMKMFFD